MNTDRNPLEDFAAKFREEYADYDTDRALHHLESRIVSAEHELLTRHPSRVLAVMPVETLDEGLAVESTQEPNAVGMWITDWTEMAACRDADPDALFVQGAAQSRAKLICRGCPVKTECLADALDNRIEFGVWGGMTEAERRALLRRRPDVHSWRELLETSEEEFELAQAVSPAVPATDWITA